MKIGATMMAAVILSSCMALAQVCVPSPGTVCLVPAPSAAGTTTTTTTAGAVTPLPLTSVAVLGCPTGTTSQVSGISSGQIITINGQQFALVPISGTGTTGSIQYVTPTATNINNVQFALVPISSLGTIQGSPMTGMSGNIAYIPVQIASPGMTMPSSMVAGSMEATAHTQMSTIINEVRALRGQVIASSLQMRGQMLVDRMNALRAREQTFRMQLAANPNLPNAQQTALNLQSEANSLNYDIAAFNRELGLVPTDVRPYIASSLNTFDVVYWTPSFQQFAAYQAQWPQTATTYQPLFAANPWLQPWWTGYQSSLTNISTSPQVFATARWWTSPQFTVAGSTEVYPGTMAPGTIMMLPAGAAIYFPAGTMPTMSTPSVTPGTTGTTGTTGAM